MRLTILEKVIAFGSVDCGIGKVIGIGALNATEVPDLADSFTPLLQINFFPDLIQVNFIPATTDVALAIVHIAPALAAAALACGSVNTDAIRTMMVKKETLRI